jgi:hypothetical protein
MGGGFDGEGADFGAEGEPFGGAGDAAQGTSPFGNADGVIALLGEGGGFGFFIGQVV